MPFAVDSKIRNKVISASRAPSVLSIGYEPRKTVMNEIFLKVPIRRNSSTYLESCLEHGKAWEHQGLERFFESPEGTGLKLVSDRQTSYQIRVVPRDCSKNSFYLVATPDAVVADKESSELIPIEVKCPKFAYDKNQVITGETQARTYFKPNYYVQIQLQMICLAAQRAYLVIYIPPADPTVFLVKRDHSYSRYMIQNFDLAIRESETEYATLRGEKKHNEELVLKRMESHCKYLSKLSSTIKETL